MRYLVDGMNVIGTRPDQWWRDRSAARRKLVQALSTMCDGAAVTVVFDGRPDAGELDEAAGSGVMVRFAPGGPNAADDVIASYVGDDPEPSSLVVVTSDGALAGKVRALGAAVMGSNTFRQRLDR
ncbi:MAG TPA: RNA-binding protein [Acidimicrobiaceae bacterium]|nr:RNA-binding protein [Acidimicrobiaceae bacterium]